MRILLTLSFAVLCVTGTMAAASDRLRAVGHQRVHPVLIGNEHNPLVTVAIEVDEPGVRVRSLTFSLDGTDDLSDIQHLELFFSDRHPPHGLDALRNGKIYHFIYSHGDRRAALAELTVPFGSPSATPAHVTFRGDRLLAPGTNYFGFLVDFERQPNFLTRSMPAVRRSTHRSARSNRAMPHLACANGSVSRSASGMTRTCTPPGSRR